MTRITENSSHNAINYAVNKTKGKIEDLQLKGSTLKRVSKISDDPIGNVELLAIRSQNIDSAQYLRNLNFAQTHLAFTENVLSEMTDILTKAKELAIGQASSIYGPEVREGVSKEIHQLREQMLNLSNKRLGNRYLFSGQKILTRPFDRDGKYFGDQNKINIEINKDVFLPINLTGKEVFFGKATPERNFDRSQTDLLTDPVLTKREPATTTQVENNQVEVSIFDELRALESAMLTDNPQIIQGLLERLDDSINRVISARTQVGALTNSLNNNENNLEKSKLFNEAHKSKIEDADVTELFSELQKEQNVLQAAYKASSTVMSNNLMDFIK
jgi:flagellar hook-associated protein 3 FlgL